MTIDRNGETDPRYQVDSPKDIVLCQCCLTEEATQYWITLNGRLRMCDWCVNSPDNDDKFLIEKL